MGPRSLHRAGTAVPGSAWLQKLWGGMIQLLLILPPLLRTLPGTGFSQPREPSGAAGSPGLFPSLPKFSRVQRRLSGRGLEPGNFPQKKGNFRARWDQLQNLWGFGGGRGGTDSAERFLSSVFKKQSEILARKCYFDHFGNCKSFQSGVFCSEVDPNIKEMGKEKSLAQLPPASQCPVQDPARWDGQWSTGGGEPSGSRVGLGPVLQGGSEAAWKSHGSRDGATVRGVGVKKLVGPDPHPRVIPTLRDRGGCSGGATIPRDKPSPVSPSLGRWSGDPWPHGLSLAGSIPNLFALQRPGPAPQIPWGKGQDPVFLPEKLWWWPGCGLWRWAERGVCLEHPLPGSSTGPGGTLLRGARRDERGPGGTIIDGPGGPGRHHCSWPGETLLENQEGHHHRARMNQENLKGPLGTKLQDQEGCCHTGPGEPLSEDQKTPGGSLSQSWVEPGGTRSPGRST